MKVAPFTGAWIEMSDTDDTEFFPGMSHPSRVRGLKSARRIISILVFIVAPFTGAWIEIVFPFIYVFVLEVAPFTGAWIEIRLS